MPILALALLVTQQASPPPAHAAGSAAKPAAAAATTSQPGVRRDVTTWVGSALEAAIGDLDGDGRAEIVLATNDAVRVMAREGKEIATTPAPGGIQVLAVEPVDGGKRGVIVTGWGASRGRRDAKARASLFRLQDTGLVEEVIATPQTDRNEVRAVLPVASGPKPSLFLAWFASKYDVRCATASRIDGAWTVADMATLRTAVAYARGDVDGDKQPDLVVGRVYGDVTGSDGDAFVLQPDGTHVPIPTTRGVRSLAVADTDGDGRNEIYFGDGWHSDYGHQAKALLTCAKWDGKAFHSELVEDMTGQYTLEEIIAADVDGDGRPEIVTSGNGYVRVMHHGPKGWRGLTIAPAARDVATGDIDGAAGDEILVLGERSQTVGLAGIKW